MSNQRALGIALALPRGSVSGHLDEDFGSVRQLFLNKGQPSKVRAGVGIIQSKEIVFPFMSEERRIKGQGKLTVIKILKILARQPFRQEKGVRKSSK